MEEGVLRIKVGLDVGRYLAARANMEVREAVISGKERGLEIDVEFYGLEELY